MSHNHGYGDDNSLNPAVYPAFVMIAIFTLYWIIFEIARQNALNALNKGYYFVEEFVSIRRKRLIPVPPENVDTSNPAHPVIINPGLIDNNQCLCCM